MVKESKILELKPHPASFIGSYAWWLYILIISLSTYLYPQTYDSICSRLAFMDCSHTVFASWALLVLVPSIVKAYKSVSPTMLLLAITVIVIGPLLDFMGYGGWSYSYIAGALSGVLGLLYVDLHRRAHHYTITDRRIVIEYRMPFKNFRRDLLYERVQEFVLEKPFLGKIFGYGHIYPVTASGIGTGTDSVSVGAGLSVKGVIGGAASTRGVKIPRSRSFFMLYGIRGAEEVYDKLVSLQSMSESAPYLRELVDDVRKLVDKKGKKP